MSSPPNKTSSKRKNEGTLIGYAQDVSEVKRNRSTTWFIQPQTYRILHGKCTRTVFTHELWRIRNRTSERSKRRDFRYKTMSEPAPLLLT